MKLRSAALTAVTFAAALSACSSVPTRSLSDTYFIDTEIVRPQREYLDRYACANGTPLICRCSSLVLGSCDCHCN